MKKERQRTKFQTGEIGTPENTFFYGYKEPLRKFEGGYGYRGVLTYSNDKDKVQCHLCGRLFKTLPTHLHFEHGTTTGQYKTKVGLSPSTALIGETTREKYIKNSNVLAHATPASKRERVRLSKQALGERRGKTLKKKSLEQRNKEGTCPDQLLQILENTAVSFGHTPTEREFKKFHRGRYYGIIVRTYGSWAKALKMLGRQTYKLPTYNDNELIQRLTDFYKQHERTPRLSDMKRGLLPSWNSYNTRFGSLNRARAMAKVPFLIHVGKRVEEWMPPESARQKMITSTR